MTEDSFYTEARARFEERWQQRNLAARLAAKKRDRPKERIDPRPIIIALSRIIRKEREKQKFSRRKLAREIGLSLDGVRRFEQNSREGVRISSIILMADALHLDLVKLMRQALKESKKTGS